MATVTPFEYDGIIFCPTVSTGAFVARRNGKIFLTGNSGFPKSLDVSKAIDKAAGAERETICKNPNARNGGGNIKVITKSFEKDNITAPATDAAKQWQGWGTSLKPANEPIVLARKPVIGTIAENVLRYGTGGLNIDGCRIEAGENDRNRCRLGGKDPGMWEGKKQIVSEHNDAGRFPTNVIHDGSDEVLNCFPDTIPSHGTIKKTVHNSGMFGIGTPQKTLYENPTNATHRFFYSAKASPSERGDKNNHPTVKPIELMQYLIKLITPPEGIVLDPYAGSGTTLIAARMLGYNYVGVELNPEYVKILHKRLQQKLGMFQ